MSSQKSSEEDYVELKDNVEKVDDSNGEPQEPLSNDDIDGDDNFIEDSNPDLEFSHKRITDLGSNDILGLEFGSEAEACEFYSTYARCHGFVMRKDDVGRDVRRNIVSRQLVCNRAGSRDAKYLKRVDRCREHRPITRTKCPARIRFCLDKKTLKWKVAAFVEGHNHSLTPPQYAHLVPANRGLSDANKAQVDSLHKFGVRTCHIMGYIVGQKGGYADLGFTKKDLYNHVDQHQRAKIKDGDANAGINYLQGKSASDPLFIGKYTLNPNDQTLQNLFWADGNSIVDYECFGDVLAFDTTYKKNRYNRPLVIFSGSNHHAQTTIFGCALVADETIETYKWLLETFLETMGNKQPKAVVTDGDAAMREAIKHVFPDATHRLCAWHLQKNACENVKNPAFLEDFKRVVYSNYTIEEFEKQWENIIVKHGLTSNKWVAKTYEKKTMWAHAYLREKFFGHIRTTSQCEGINSLIKSYIRKKNSLIEFMQNFDLAIREYRNNELISDFKTFDGEPVLTTPLHKIEACAAEAYTKEIFMEVKSEIEEACALNIVHRSKDGENVILRMNTYCSPRNECEVVFDGVNNAFMCDCRLFESRGIPCRHIFCAMKNEHIESIPDSLICKRWTKAAKSDYICSVPAEEIDTGKMAKLRFGSLAADCNRLCHLASQEVDLFIDIRDKIYKLISMAQFSSQQRKRKSSYKKVVGDPMLVKTKGAPSKKRLHKRKRHCSSCHKTGHYWKRCPRFPSTKDFHEATNASIGEASDASIGEAYRQEDSEESMHEDANVDCSGELLVSNLVDKATVKKCEERKIKKVMGVHSTQESLTQFNDSQIKDNGERVKRSKIHKRAKARDDNGGSKIVASIDDIDQVMNSIPIAPRNTPQIGYWHMTNQGPVFQPYPLYPTLTQVTGIPPFHGYHMYPHHMPQIFGPGGLGVHDNGGSGSHINGR